MADQQLELAFAKLGKALQALELMVYKPMQEDRSNVDACIQRFEFTVELFWKALRIFLATKGDNVAYPKDILREAYKGNLIDAEQIWLQMLLDRNQTAHTYDEGLADQIYARIKEYYPVMQKTYARLLTQIPG